MPCLLMKNLLTPKKNMMTLAPVCSDTSATADRAVSVDGATMFKLKNRLSVFQPQPNFAVMSATEVEKHERLEFTASKDDTSSNWKSDTRSLGSEVHLKATSSMSPRPETTPIKSEDKHHGKWGRITKFAKMIIKGKKSKKDDYAANNYVELGDNSEHQHKWRQGVCKRCLVRKPKNVNRSTNLLSHDRDFYIPESQTPGQMGMNPLIRNVDVDIGMDHDTPKGMPTFIRTVNAAIEGPRPPGMPISIRIVRNDNDVSPSPPQLAPIRPLPLFTNEFYNVAIEDRSPISEESTDLDRSSNESVLSQSTSVTEDELPDSTPVLIWQRPFRAAEDKNPEILKNRRWKTHGDLEFPFFPFRTDQD